MSQDRSGSRLAGTAGVSEAQRRRQSSSEPRRARPGALHQSSNPRSRRPVPRCVACGLHKPLCLCDFAAPLPLRTRVIVAMHGAERAKSSNTGRLLSLALTHCEVRIRDLKEQAFLTNDIIDGHGDAWLLYPTDDAEEITYSPKPVTLVVPDGNWRQARKVVRRELSLAGLRRVRLPPGPPSKYRLRDHPDVHRVCTMEAVARALGVLEGPSVQLRLEAWLDAFVGRTLLTRGVHG